MLGNFLYDPHYLDSRLLQACAQSSVQGVQLLLVDGANPAYEDLRYGITGTCFRISPIHHALKSQNLALLKLLLEKGANPNARHEDIFMRGGSNYTKIIPIARIQTPLHIAINAQSAEAVQLLLDRRAGVNDMQVDKGKNAYGLIEDSQLTPLHVVCQLPWSPEMQQIVGLLIKNGADVNMMGNYIEDGSPLSTTITNVHNKPVYLTPLHIAIKSGNTELIKILISAGANRSISLVRGMIDTDVWELCGDNRILVEALKYSWSTDFHKYFPKRVRNAIFCVMLIAKRQRWGFDPPIMHHLFSFVVFNWLKS